jgi:hypothetical protein
MPKSKKITKPEPEGVKEMMNIFYTINPTLNWANMTFRSSAIFMIEKFGKDESLAMANAAVSIQGQPYAPTITNPWELKEKLIKVKMFFGRNKEINQGNISKI